MQKQRDDFNKLIAALEKLDNQDDIEKALSDHIKVMSGNDTEKDSSNFYSFLNYCLYKFILRGYKLNEERICLWRFYKKISSDQLNLNFKENSPQELLDYFIRTFYYSDPLDDLTCIFIPINEFTHIEKYIKWIKNYFYDANYPTSILWLYALDSSMTNLFPDEIVYIGKRIDDESVDENIMIPDYNYKNAILMKRFSDAEDDFNVFQGEPANKEFKQIFDFLKDEYQDRCLSRSGKQEDDEKPSEYEKEWEKFGDVLQFGVSDKAENGTVSFSDLRSSTNFLNKYGKSIFRNKIQQPFFEKTKFITRKFNGRIDKFMGDNVMCVFFDKHQAGKLSHQEKEEKTILHNFFALFNLCRLLNELIDELNLNETGETTLGLRSGVTYGNQILRSNLGNEIVRDFTVTGETVNLAARLEHISMQELMIQSEEYFENTIERFPEIKDVINVINDYDNLNDETKSIINNYTLYQNMISNLKGLSSVRYDIRFNEEFYNVLSTYLMKKGYRKSEENIKRRDIHGYDEYNVHGFTLKFYYSFYMPKGFSNYEKIWILPLEIDTLENLVIEDI